MTVGRDIAFAAGRYAPGSATGDALLAHELAHVVQQTGGPEVARLEDPLLEADADSAALDAVLGLRATAARRTGQGIQRCGDDVAIPEKAPPRPYKEIVTELQGLRARKEAVLAGKEPTTSLPEIEARIEAIGAELRDMGVKLETREIMDRLAAAPGTDLMQVKGQLVRSPQGTAHLGDKLEFQAVLDYVPAGRNVEYEWRWKANSRTAQFYTGERGSADRVSLGSGFWSGEMDVTKAGGMEVYANVYLGDEEQPVTKLTTGFIPMTKAGERDFDLKASQKVTIVDAPVIIEPEGWAPTLGEHWLVWYVDGRIAADRHFVFTHKFGTPGTKKVRADLHGKGDTLLASRGDLIASKTIDIVVQDPAAAAEQMLGQMSGEQAPPATKQLEASLESSIREIEKRAADGGEQQDYWVERLKAQRKRLAKLREQIPDLASSEVLPGDPSAVESGHAYTGPVKAVLILPSGGGPQPLSMYLRAWQVGVSWKARLVDMTGADVYAREGSGTTALDAYQEAFREWIDDHPYPRGAKVRYEFNPPGWSVPTTFKCRDTPWETVKAWVDGILTVGGVIVGGLLLLTPEPTGATKALGLLFIAASAARSAIAIYENLELGIDALDPRNVVEGLSIVTSVLGVSGSLLRQYGIKAISPLVYRVGNWTVMASLAGDAGTIAFMSQEALAQLRAVQADPTKDDSQKNAEFIRVAAQLFASGALFFATNKDLVKQGLRPSDFFKTAPKLSGGKQPSLSTGSRLDLGLELKKVGDVHTAERISAGKIADSELLDRHAVLPWLKTGTAPDVAEVSKRLTPATLSAVQDASVKDVRAAIDQIADDAAVNAVAGKLKGPGLVATAPGVARVKKLDPAAKVEIMGDGQLKLEGQITLGIGKLETLGNDAAIQEFLGAVRKLREAGSIPALKATDPAAADLIEKLGKARWRFGHHLDKANAFLADMGLSANDPPFKTMSDHDRVRLFDMNAEPVPFIDPTDPATKELKTRFSEYAVGQKPATVTEYVDHFSYARARYRWRVDELAAEFEQEVLKRMGGTPPMARGAAEKEVKTAMKMGGPGQPKNFKEKARAELSDPTWKATVAAHEAQALKEVVPHLGGVKIATGTDAEVEAALRAKGHLPMADDATAAYHAEKHHNELPQSLRFKPEGGSPAGVATKADAYFKSAADVVRDPTSTVTPSVAQDGKSKSYMFVRPFTEPGAKKPFQQTVIILVTPDGKAIMLTYMPNKS